MRKVIVWFVCLFVFNSWQKFVIFDDSFGGHQFGLLVKVFSVFESLSEKK